MFWGVMGRVMSMLHVLMGRAASQEQYEKIKSYLEIGKQEGAEVLSGGNIAQAVEGGFYIQPTIFKVRGGEEARDKGKGLLQLLACCSWRIWYCEGLA